MDPVSNLERQRELAARILEHGGSYHWQDEDSVDGQELAELVQSLDEWRRKREDVQNVAAKLSLDTVPDLLDASLVDAIALVSATDGLGGPVTSRWPNAPIEGIVGRPSVDLFDRRGDRIVTKIKVKDFVDLERRGEN